MDNVIDNAVESLAAVQAEKKTRKPRRAVTLNKVKLLGSYLRIAKANGTLAQVAEEVNAAQPGLNITPAEVAVVISQLQNGNCPKFLAVALKANPKTAGMVITEGSGKDESYSLELPFTISQRQTRVVNAEDIDELAELADFGDIDFSEKMPEGFTA